MQHANAPVNIPEGIISPKTIMRVTLRRMATQDGTRLSRKRGTEGRKE